MEKHHNDVNVNISEIRLPKKSEGILKDAVICTFNGCMTHPCVRCLLCLKYYCYRHLHKCLQIHPNELEVIRL